MTRSLLFVHTTLGRKLQSYHVMRIDKEKAETSESISSDLVGRNFLTFKPNPMLFFQITDTAQTTARNPASVTLQTSPTTRSSQAELAAAAAATARADPSPGLWVATWPQRPFVTSTATRIRTRTTPRPGSWGRCLSTTTSSRWLCSRQVRVQLIRLESLRGQKVVDRRPRHMREVLNLLNFMFDLFKWQLATLRLTWLSSVQKQIQPCCCWSDIGSPVGLLDPSHGFRILLLSKKLLYHQVFSIIPKPHQKVTSRLSDHCRWRGFIFWKMGYTNSR